MHKIAIISAFKQSEEYIDGILENVRNHKNSIDRWIIVITPVFGDRTEEIIRDSEISLEIDTTIILSNEPGIYIAWNKAIKRCLDESFEGFIGMLSADDLLVNLDYIRTANSTGIISGNAKNLIPEKDKRNVFRSDLKCFRFRMTICHPATFIHSSVFKDRGFYSQEYYLSSDWDYLLKNIDLISTVDEIFCSVSPGGFSNKNYHLSLKENLAIQLPYIGKLAYLVYLLRKVKYLFWIR